MVLNCPRFDDLRGLGMADNNEAQMDNALELARSALERSHEMIVDIHPQFRHFQTIWSKQNEALTTMLDVLIKFQIDVKKQIEALKSDLNKLQGDSAETAKEIENVIAVLPPESQNELKTI